MSTIREGLDALAVAVGSGSFGTAREWGAAEVMVTKGDPELRMDEFSRFSEPVVVRTPHAAELSWLFTEVRRVFTEGRPQTSGTTGSGAWLGGGGSGRGAQAVTAAARDAASSGVTDQDLFAAMADQVNRVLAANPEACTKTQLSCALQYAYWVAGRLEG